MRTFILFFALIAVALGQSYIRFHNYANTNCTGSAETAEYFIANVCIPDDDGTAGMITYNSTQVSFWSCTDMSCEASTCTEVMAFPIGMCAREDENSTVSFTVDVNRTLADLADQTYITPLDIISLTYGNDMCGGPAPVASVIFSGELCYENSRLVCTDVCQLTYYGGCTFANETSCSGCSQSGINVADVCLPAVGMNQTYAISKCGAWGYNCSDITTTTTGAATTGAATTTGGSATTTTGGATTTGAGTTTARPTSGTTTARPTTAAGTTGNLPATTGAASSLSATVATVMAAVIAVFML